MSDLCEQKLDDQKLAGGLGPTGKHNPRAHLAGYGGMQPMHKTALERRLGIKRKNVIPAQVQPVVSRFVYLEEYERCGCSFAARFKRDLIGYCSIHGTDRKRCTKLPDPSNTFKLGFAG